MSDTPITTPRRVLGALSANTPTTASKLKSPTSAVVKPISLPAMSCPGTPPRVGQKRSIDRVDEAVSRSATRGSPKPQTEARDKLIRIYEDAEMPLKRTKSNTSDSISTNTPSHPTEIPLLDSGGDASQASIKDSMSSLIDFDPDDESASSFQTAPTEPSTPLHATARSRAEALRLRLRVAMFKVKTHQTNIPLSRLQISPGKSVHVPPPHRPFPAQEPVAPPNAQDRSGIPKLLPAPILVPTAYSARHIYTSPIPSSPPNSASSSQERPSADFATSALPRQKHFHPPMQLSSPPESQSRNVERARGVEAEAKLTSSVVKGRAANGLLDLMNMG
ncbi:MAG: hypothetical protein M1830_007805 [Pleopsidium flavum]|nr:MAG: hypothetical protein M1830_007805 [Pleopsidium flavum]